MNNRRDTRRSSSEPRDTDSFSQGARRNAREGNGSYSDASRSVRTKGASSSRSSRNTAPTNGNGRNGNSRRSSSRSRDGQFVEEGNGYSARYSRQASQAEYGKKRKKSRKKKIVFGALAGVLILVLGAAGVAFAYYNTVSENLHEGIDNDLRDTLVKTELTKEPFYMVLMGTDGSDERANSAEYAGDPTRSDSIMLARIDPVDNKVTLISLHRDTMVTLDGYGVNKLNAAYAYGGASLAVKTVSKLADVPISHYAEINFDGFKEIVDALGGVEVDVPVTINDADAGGYVAQGLQTLNGDQALILCRSRHTYDDYGDGDSYRAANQRLVLAAIAKKMLASDVGTMTSTITTLSKYIKTDLEITDIIGLAQAMQGIDTSKDIYSAMQPTTSTYTNDIWYEITDETEWKAMMSRVKQGLSPTEQSVVDQSTGVVLANAGESSSSSSSSSSSTVIRSGSVIVKNGCGIEGVASSAAAKLQAVGYTVTTGNANDYTYTTTLVIYADASKASEAKEMVSTLGIGKTFKNDGTYAFTGDFLVVVGSDWG